MSLWWQTSPFSHCCKSKNQTQIHSDWNSNPMICSLCCSNPMICTHDCSNPFICPLYCSNPKVRTFQETGNLLWTGQASDVFSHWELYLLSWWKPVMGMQWGRGRAIIPWSLLKTFTHWYWLRLRSGMEELLSTLLDKVRTCQTQCLATKHIRGKEIFIKAYDGV